MFCFTCDRSFTWTQRSVQFSLAIVVESGRKSEVSNLDLHGVVEEQIGQLEIAVYDLRSVEVGTR